MNLGCGRGYSVLEVVKAFEKASGRHVPYELVERREGDIAANWCDPSLAETLLSWKAVHTIDDMCRDAWRFEANKLEGSRGCRSYPRASQHRTQIKHPFEI